MNRSLMNIVLIVSCIFVSNVSAQFQYDFFWSDMDLGSEALNQDLEIDLQVGEETTLFLYWSTNGPADSDISVGCAVDVMTSQTGIIRFESAESMDYDITIPSSGNADFGNRLTDDQGGGGFCGPAGIVENDMIVELIAFTVNGGPGVLEANNGS